MLVMALTAAALAAGTAFLVGRHAAPAPAPTATARELAPPVFVPSAPDQSGRASTRRPPARPTESALANQRAVAALIRDEASKVDSPAALDTYLQALEARARRRGHVTAIDYDPGLAALRRMQQDLGDAEFERRYEAFTDRMVRMSEQFDPPRPIASSFRPPE
jgi:hypothetical protein